RECKREGGIKREWRERITFILRARERGRETGRAQVGDICGAEQNSWYACIYICMYRKRARAVVRGKQEK
ncbi:MAG: hypothetical protein ACOVQL_09690, partial [Limnohabitans sp.]